MHACVAFDSERLCTKQGNRAEDAEAAAGCCLNPHCAGLCWALQVATRGFALLHLFSLSRRREIVLCYAGDCYARRRKSKKRCGHGRGHEGSGDPGRPKAMGRGTALMESREYSSHQVRGVHAMPWQCRCHAEQTGMYPGLLVLW